MAHHLTIKDGKPENCYTTEEFAKMCNVSRGTVRQWIHRKRICPIRVGNNNYIPYGTERPRRKRYGEPEDVAMKTEPPDPAWKYYWRVAIGLADRESPLLEIAGFMSASQAQDYIDNVIRARADWDSKSMFAIKRMYALPPITLDNDTLGKRIAFLKAVKDAESHS